MYRSNHVAEVVHANVHTSSLSEQAVVEVLLILFGVVWSISDRVSILLLGVASPHSVDWFLAGQEVIGLLLEHSSVTNINTFQNNKKVK